MLDSYPDIIIFSVFQNGVSSYFNYDNHRKVFNELKGSGVPCIELFGKYNNTLELSILVQDFKYRSIIEQACKDFNQECYLESYGDRSACLIYPDGNKEFIGTITQVTEKEAEESDSFSYNPISKQYFTCK